MSRHSSSSELSSEVAPEIVVWTEDMDVDSLNDELSELDSSNSYVKPDFVFLTLILSTFVDATLPAIYLFFFQHTSLTLSLQ